MERTWSAKSIPVKHPKLLRPIVKDIRSLVLRGSALWPTKGYRLLRQRRGLFFVVREDEPDIMRSEVRIIQFEHMTIIKRCRCPQKDEDDCLIVVGTDGVERCAGEHCCEGEATIIHPGMPTQTYSF